MTDLSIIHLNENDQAALFCRFPGQFRAQDCYLELDLEDGKLSADWNGEIGNGVPQSVWSGRTRRFPIPCLTASAANRLMESLAPLAQRVLNGASVEWSENGDVGRLDADASQAEAAIVEWCDPESGDWDPSQMVGEWSASDWYSDDTTTVLAEYGITADSTDARLADVAAEETEKATTIGTDGFSVLMDAESWLHARRDEMRDAQCEELETVAEQLAALTAKRNDLICKVSAWGCSSRSTGTLAGISHTQVRNIVAAERTVSAYVGEPYFAHRPCRTCRARGRHGN